MATFYYKQCVKCTIWRDYSIEIEAESEEDAKRIAIERFGKDEANLYNEDEFVNVYDSELEFDTEEFIPTIKDNGMASTIYLYDRNAGCSKDPFYMNGEC